VICVPHTGPEAPYPLLRLTDVKALDGSASVFAEDAGAVV